MRNNIRKADFATWFKAESCCGCEACVSICTKGVLEMRRSEEGFYYPSLIEANACIHCGACYAVCPINNIGSIKSKFTKAYAGWAASENDIIRSASGGFAAVLSRVFIKNGGVVYGVSYTEDLSGASYIRATSEQDIDRLRGSKYIQARKHDVFRLIREDLLNRDVLFFGTPCDTYALLRFVKDRSRLSTVSIICHGPTSETVHQSYCSEIEKSCGRIKHFTVRYKKNNEWKPYYIHADLDNNEAYETQFNKTDYNKAFIYFKRPSCLVCPFKKNKFASDILIGDYHAAELGMPSYNAHGVSCVLPLTDCANDLIRMTATEFELKEVRLRTAIHQQAIHSPVSKIINRESFSNALNTYGLKDACKTQTFLDDVSMNSKESFKARVVLFCKKVIWNTLRR